MPGESIKFLGRGRSADVRRGCSSCVGRGRRPRAAGSRLAGGAQLCQLATPPQAGQPAMSELIAAMDSGVLRRAPVQQACIGGEFLIRLAAVPAPHIGDELIRLRARQPELGGESAAGRRPRETAGADAEGYRPDRHGARLGAECDRAVSVQGPAGVVRHFPWMAVQVDEYPGVSAPEGPGRLAADDGTGGAGLVNNVVDRIGGADIVRQCHASPAACVADRAVLRQHGAVPQGEDQAACLEERDVVGFIITLPPAQGLVELPGTAQIGDAERDDTDPLVHWWSSCRGRAHSAPAGQPGNMQQCCYTFRMRLLADIRPLRESRPFRRLWAGLTLSAVGGAMTSFAVVLQVYELTHSAFAVGALGLTRMIPTLTVGLFGGAFTDAIDRRKLALATTSCLAAISALFAAQAFAGLDQLWLLYVLVAVQSAVSAVDSPARRTFTPHLLPAGQLSAGLALNQLT